jgi:N-acetyl-anhydromuramyl-L-alanine amidase AmpD
VLHRTLIGHNELNPADRPNDPGPNLDFAKIAQAANAGNESLKPQTPKKAMARGR